MRRAKQRRRRVLARWWTFRDGRVIVWESERTVRATPSLVAALDSMMGEALNAREVGQGEKKAICP